MNLSRAARTRLQWMLFYFFNGRNAVRTCRHFGISRQTFYRWKRRFDRHDLTTLEEHSHRPRSVRQPTWTAQLAEQVLLLRQQYPRWGKDKLVVLLAREKCLAHLKRRGRCTNRSSQPCCGRHGESYGNAHGPFASLNTGPSSSPEIWWSIDTKEIRMRRGVIRKHFSARDVVSRWDVVEVHGRATSLAAAGFLEVLLERMPFRVKALQVDGGSDDEYTGRIRALAGLFDSFRQRPIVEVDFYLYAQPQKEKPSV